MKHLLFAFFLLSTAPVTHAGINHSPGECLEMYRIYLQDQNYQEPQSQEVPLHFTATCLPDSASNNNSHYIELMKLMENDNQIVVLESRLLERGFVF